MDNPGPTSFAADPLLASERIETLRAQWRTIEASFDAAPERAVEHADHLVAQTTAALAEAFTRQRADLEGQWGHGVEATREELQRTLQLYRDFFERLISV